MADEPRNETGHTGSTAGQDRRFTVGPTPDLADVLIDITAVQGRINHLAGDLALALPADRQQVCRRLLAMLGDGLDLLDDYASGRIR